MAFTTAQYGEVSTPFPHTLQGHPQGWTTLLDHRPGQIFRWAWALGLHWAQALTLALVSWHAEPSCLQWAQVFIP